MTSVSKYHEYKVHLLRNYVHVRFSLVTFSVCSEHASQKLYPHFRVIAPTFLFLCDEVLSEIHDFVFPIFFRAQLGLSASEQYEIVLTILFVYT
jgi:hypothetical protein